MLGLSITLDTPLWATSIPRDVPIVPQVMSYSHDIDVFGGFKSAEFSFVTRGDSEDWLSTLGYDVTVRDEDLTVAFEGFINEVEIQHGGITTKRGPLVDYPNKLRVTYRTVRYNTNPPIGGDERTTDFTSDTDAQAFFPIIEDTISVTEVSTANAIELRDTYAAAAGWPRTSRSIFERGSGVPTVTIRCLGYFELANHYYYEYKTSVGEVDIDTKIQRVLTADPNSVFSTDYVNIDENTQQIGEYEDGTRRAYEIIQELVSMGDTSDNRWLFGLYEDRLAVYEAAPTTIGLLHYAQSNESFVIDDVSSAPINPLQVRPGRWMLLSDRPDSMEHVGLNEANLAVFIEGVQFTSPNTLSIRGGKTETLKQKLFKLGLGGTS